jgi:hypothetical protein
MSLTSYRAAPPRVTKNELRVGNSEAFCWPDRGTETAGGLLHPRAWILRLPWPETQKGPRLKIREALGTWTARLLAGP